MDAAQVGTVGDSGVTGVIRETTSHFRARDGRVLGGSWFEGPSPRATLVVNGGTGIPQGFYAKFAKHAASRGFATLTYDYRGMGRSRVGLLRDENATMHEWGRFDMSGALDHALERFPGVPAFVLGHSVGGQLVGLMENHARASAYVFVTASTGVWWRMPPAYGLFTASLWYGLFPATSLAYGYVPGRALGLGEDLPRGVAKEWGRWCTSRDYFVRALARDGIPSFHAQVSAPLLSLSYTDDPIANRRNVDQLLGFYPSAKVERVHAAPRESGRRSIGHLGFFRSSNAVLWERPLTFLEAHLTG